MFSGSETFSSRFQSTLPVGGATPNMAEIISVYRISIHAPRGGSDGSCCSATGTPATFQSTLPVGGATINNAMQVREEINFNPRSPWGERRYNPI